MNYKNAKQVLPENLVKEIQKYISGQYVYIPIEDQKKKNWGELSGTKHEINLRNKEIVQLHKNGISIDELTERFYLSCHSIKKIIYKNK